MKEPDQSRAWFFAISRAIHYLILVPFGRMRVMGVEHIPKEGPFLLACNHMSDLDPPATGGRCPRPLRVLAKQELFKNKFFGFVIRKLGAVPLHRGEADTQAIKTALQWLKEGQAVLMFPEGKRGSGAQLLPMQPGLAMLAKKTDCLIVPAGIVGSETVLPAGAKGLKFGRITLSYGAPFRYSDVPGGTREAFNTFLAERISDETERAGRRIKIANEDLPQETAPTPELEAAPQPETQA